NTTPSSSPPRLRRTTGKNGQCGHSAGVPRNSTVRFRAREDSFVMKTSVTRNEMNEADPTESASKRLRARSSNGRRGGLARDLFHLRTHLALGLGDGTVEPLAFAGKVLGVDGEFELRGANLLGGPLEGVAPRVAPELRYGRAVLGDDRREAVGDG